MPPLPADSIHARACKLKCEKILTRPIPAATFCLGSDGLLYEGKLRFRPLNADLLAALEPLAEQWEQEHKNGGDG